ncbi:hypothetical protein [Desulforegula conservatrix]|uniref:hypothetical protein n=1 Tax=Desulforegula conservatrix TaxID=153026 RepID=UPI0004243DEC|nr:hypothetical protein [Desulforegula conservatrix]
MAFCPFLSLKIQSIKTQLVDQVGKVYTRNPSGQYLDAEGNSLETNEPVAIASALAKESLVISLRDSAGNIYAPDSETGKYLDQEEKTAFENESDLSMAVTEGSEYGFFRCPEDGSCKLWDVVNSRCGMMGSDALLKMAGQSSGSKPPKAAILVNEYMGAEDLDGNGLIYGKTFYIKADSRPPMLASLPEKGSALTWDEYLQTLAH